VSTGSHSSSPYPEPPPAPALDPPRAAETPDRTGSRTPRERSNVALIGLTLVVLIVGWARTWPNLNRDFNHLHGWNAAFLGELARTTGHAGLPRVGFAAVLEPLYDVGRNYWYIFHYGPLLTFVLAPVGRFASGAYEHATLRLLGIVVTIAYLIFLYLLGRRLRGPRFAAWTLFFGAISAEVFFFGAFTGFDYVGSIMLVAAAYLAYVAWRTNPRTSWPRAAILLLSCAFLWDFNSYVAAAPIFVDLVWFDPARVGARKWRPAVVVAVLPVLAVAAQEFDYRVVVPLLIHREPFALSRDLRLTLAMRGNYKLLATFWFYRELIRSSTTYVAPVGVAVTLLFLVRYAPRLRSFLRGPRNVPWQLAFVASTFGLAVFLIMFPQSTLVHQFTYFQVGLPLALAGAYYVTDRGNVIKLAAIAGTILVAFSTAGWFRGLNNTPLWEFETGVGIRLSTPEGSFVRVPIAADLDTPMMLFYSNRPLLFNLPPQFTPAVNDTRFDVAFQAPAIPDNVAGLFIPVANAVVLDRHPSLRVALPNVGRVYGNGAWIVWSAAVTEAYRDWRMVEIDWIARRKTKEHLGVEIGEYINGQWTGSVVAKLRGNTVDTAGAQVGQHYRDGFLVPVSHEGQLVLRIIDLTSNTNRSSDLGVLDLPLLQTTPLGRGA